MVHAGPAPEAVGISAISALPQRLDHLLLRARHGLQIAEDVLDQDHGRIDDDAEVDGADGEEVGVLALQHHQDDGEEQGEGNVHADDDGAAQVAEEDPLDQEHEQAAEDEVVQHRVRGDVHQRGAVVIGYELHARRQRAVAVQGGDGRLDARHDVVGVLGASHDHDRGHHVVVVIAAGDAEARHVADVDPRDVLHQHRHAVVLAEDDVLDVVDVIALGEIVVAAVVDEPHAADVHGLLADRDLAAADVDVRVAERAQELRHGDVVGLELARDRPRPRIPWSCRPSC